MKWRNNYRRKGVARIPITLKFDKSNTERLAMYAEIETKRHGRKVSQSAIVETLLEKDKGFRQVRMPEQEAHASSSKDNSNIRP